MDDAKRKEITEATKELVDKGLLIEAGFASLVISCDLKDAPVDQLREMRMAFFAGAQHLFASIQDFMEEGIEPTSKDLERMDLIQAELDNFINEFMVQHIPTVGGRQ